MPRRSNAAKVLGGIASGLTIAALIRTSFEVFDIFQTSYNQQSEFQKWNLRFSIEKCRLYVWGESVGATELTGPNNQLQFPQTIQQILQNLTRLFRDAERIKDRYDPKKNIRITHPELPSLTMDELDTIGANIKDNVTWVVFDRRRFSSLILEIRELITELRDITSSSLLLDGEDGRTNQNFADVNDTEALALVGGICSIDHPDVQRLRQQRPLLWSRIAAQRETRAREEKQRQLDSQFSRQSQSQSQSSDYSQADSDVTRWPGVETFRYGNLRL